MNTAVRGDVPGLGIPYLAHRTPVSIKAGGDESGMKLPIARPLPPSYPLGTL
jgi:hypothetical protein